MEASVSGSSSSSRATRFMMEGVGARVIRGPDWKWGKQVHSSAVVTIVYLYSFYQKTSNNFIEINTMLLCLNRI